MLDKKKTCVKSSIMRKKNDYKIDGNSMNVVAYQFGNHKEGKRGEKNL